MMFSHRSAPAALVLAGALVLGACGSDADADAAADDTAAEDTTTTAAAPAEVEITHAQGTTTVDVDPEVVVVFDLGALVTMDEIGAEADAVPTVATLPDSLAEYAGDDVPKVGTLFEPDYEAVSALEPDLIIVGGRSSAVYPQLAEIAPTVDLTVDNEDFMASFKERTEAIGTIFDAEDEVAERLDQIDAGIERVNELAADAGDALIVLTTGGEVSAFGPGSRFGIIHDILGVTPAIEDVEEASHGDAVSFEFILEANPDILYVVDRDSATGEAGETAAQVLDNELVAQTTAWQNDDVVYLDPFTWYLAPNGLGSVADMVDTIEASLG